MKLKSSLSTTPGHRARTGTGRTAVLLLSLTTNILIGLLGAAFVSVATATATAAAASPSEVFEQGIYSEETKGDLDTALQLYQQIVTDAKSAQALAAQAQYHLGVCYYKKKDYAAAKTAFEKLAKDYPDQKDLVARAQEYLAGATVLLPEPWTDGEELRMDVKFPTGFKLGIITTSVHAAETNGHKIWQLTRHTYAGVQAVSRVEVEADTFKPLHSLWKHTLIGEADTTYYSDHADVKSKGKDTAKKVDLTPGVYDNEEALPFMRRLPLTAGYKADFRSLSGLGGGGIIPIKLEVTAVEKVTVPAGTFECNKCELSIHQTFWYSTDPHHYLVKFEAEGVVVELAEIAQLKAGEPVTYQDPDYHFSMTAPPDWVFYHAPSDDAKKKSSVIILDPNANALTAVEFSPLSNLADDARKSVRDWANWEVKDAANALKDLKVRPDGWQERTVAGQPGVSAVADYIEGKADKSAYAVFSFLQPNSVNFKIMTDANQLDAFRPKLDAIVDSFKVQ